MSKNLLRHETSPYLRQHAGNPVHWYAWGTDAFDTARRLDRPVLLSVGYAACHWCHVMAHESFEDAETAAVMNALFINIKVDREERPDIDQLYMAALHALGEQGGWPLTMFLTPEGKPIWGGTYFPPTSRYGRPGFSDVLKQVSTLYREERANLIDQADRITAHLESRRAPPSDTALSGELVGQAAEAILAIMDRERGGTRGAPKFPNAPVLDLLARAGENSDRPDCRDILETTLHGLCQGGIFDHVGGGFARYSTDADWLVPHFEKMLYDNGLLLEQLAHALPRSPHAALYRDRIETTVDWLLRELRMPGGGFAAGLDADSEGVEGRFYVWSRDEIDAVLGPDDARMIARLYDITPHGNWEGQSIPNRLRQADPAGIEDDPRRRAALETLRRHRDQRVRPALDDQMLTDWNGLAIAGLATAGAALARPDWIDAARAAYRFIEDNAFIDGRPVHVWCGGRRGAARLSTDLAALARAALALHQATGEAGWIEQTEQLLERLERHHGDGHGGYFLSPDDGEKLILRKNDRTDEATPNAHGMAAEAYIKLWALTGDDRRRARADRILAAAGSIMRGNVFGTASLLAALDLRLRVTTIVLIATEGEDHLPLLNEARRQRRRHILLDLVTAGAALPVAHPAHGKTAITGRTTAYVCHEGRCSLPVTEAGALAAMLAEMA